MKKVIALGLCVGCLFSLGYMAGITMTAHVVESAARERLETFSHQVNVLEGRVVAMETLCHP
jgi:hypothetical protein